MKEQKRDWVVVFSKVLIAVFFIGMVVLAVSARQIFGTNEPGTEMKEAKTSVFKTAELYYNDNNTFERTVYDPDTMVMYVIIDGKMSPLYNADGTLKTYKPD